MSAVVNPFAATAKQKSRWATETDELFALVFSPDTLPGVNSTVQASFKSPLQTLHYLEALVSAVLDSDKPKPPAAKLHFWKHLHRCVRLSVPLQVMLAASVIRVRQTPLQSPFCPGTRMKSILHFRWSGSCLAMSDIGAHRAGRLPDTRRCDHLVMPWQSGVWERRSEFEACAATSGAAL
jgi:hypothetical protein